MAEETDEMTQTLARYSPQSIQHLIVQVRGQKAILDRDLAAVYGVPTGRFNEAVKRNSRRFPGDFVFQLTVEETAALISQSAISKSGRGGRRTLPFAFTEHGAVMAANILHTERAIHASVFVVRAFVRMRNFITAQRGLTAKLAELERRLTVRLAGHEWAMIEAVREMLLVLQSPPAQEPPGRQMGFNVKERPAQYRTGRSRRR